MKKYPLLLFLIFTMLLFSIPGAVVSAGDMNFTYPAAAVMIQTLKNRQIARVVYPRRQGLPERMLYHPKPEQGETAEDFAAGEDNSTGSVAAVRKSDIETGDAAVKDVSPTDDITYDDSSDEAIEAEAVSINEVGINLTENKDAETDNEDETEPEADIAGSEVPEDDDPTDYEDDVYDEEDSYDEPSDDDWREEFVTVDDDYFEDACFIGDSRVAGLGLYSSLPAANYGNVGMQLYRIFDKKVVDTEDGRITIPEMLASGQEYGKVYMGFGLNEMGWGNDKMFADYYYGLIDYIKAVQPDAVLYIMGLIHVTEGEEKRSSLYNNDAVNQRNELLKEIADNERIYYLDLNEVFTDEYGRLASEDSFDGIHIKANAIGKWVDYLKTHAIEP